jgi:hypothetical protein
MPYQECTPSDCYGPIQQHVFLGASVMNITAQQGWGGEVGELTVTLVEDECDGPKIYFDNNLTLQSGNFADPGFFGHIGNIIGRPVYFGFVSTGTVPDFEFAGIVKNWDSTTSAAGSDIITVKISSPTEILNSSQVITDEYTGATNVIPNVFNVFGFYEGSSCSTFGDSQQTEKGMPWSKVKEGIGLLTSAIPTPASVLSYSQNGRLQYVAGSASGYGLIPEDYLGYFVDLSEIPDGPTYYRIQGVNNSLQDIINTVTNDFGYDYYTELVPVNLAGNIMKIIKVRVADRNSQPLLGAISNFVNYSDVSGCGTIEKSSGQELRSELTNTFVLGGRKKQMYWVENYSGNWDLSDDLIEPYWGLDIYGNVIHSAISGNDIVFTGNTAELSYSLADLTFPSSVTITETEIRTAAAGFDSWASYISTVKTPTYEAITGLNEGVKWGGLQGLRHLAGLIASVSATTPIRGSDLISLESDSLNDAQFNDLGLIHEYFETLATTYYGRKYTVRLPELCAYLDPTTNELILTREVSEGGWNETGGSEFTNLIGINTTSVAADFFRNQQGLFTPFVRYNNVTGLDYGALTPDQYGAVSGQFDDGSGNPVVGSLWVKNDVEQNFVFGNATTYSDPRVLITIPQSVHRKEIIPENTILRDFEHLVDIVNGINRGAGGDDPATIANELKEKIGNATFASPGYPRAVQPNASTVALQNNQEIYGPWYAGTLGAVGNTEVRQDDSLAPWNFGGMTLMDTAGQAIADQGVTNMQVGEMGHIRVAGLPTIALGAELLTYNGAGYNAGQRFAQTRVATSQTVGGVTYYSTDILAAGRWLGNFGPNITNISINVDSNGGITTTYSLRTFTPVFGQFAKYNAERLKEIGSIKQRMLSLRKGR